MAPAEGGRCPSFFKAARHGHPTHMTPRHPAPPDLQPLQESALVGEESLGLHPGAHQRLDTA